jgi:hypothetical protein
VGMILVVNIADLPETKQRNPIGELL